MIEKLENENAAAIGESLKKDKLITPEDLALIKKVPRGQKRKRAAILTHAMYRTIAVTPGAFSAIHDTLSRHKKLKEIFLDVEIPG